MEALAVTSRSFSPNGAIPVDNTCDGANRSPQLTWSTPPRATKSLAIVAEDPDAPGGMFTHWIAYDIRPDVLAIPEGADVSTLGGALGMNDFERLGYAGPCPPRMEMHRYLFRVFALDGPMGVGAEASRGAVDTAMAGHVVGVGTLAGMFSH
jgi:Raf kinase inhibitor-like YbhB/YbcL family protein